MSDVHGAPPPNETMHDPHDVWRVQLATGEIRVMTLEALDGAFEEGIIDERTPVLAPFAPTWATLGVVAGLEHTHTNPELEDTQPELEALPDFEVVQPELEDTRPDFAPSFMELREVMPPPGGETESPSLSPVAISSPPPLPDFSMHDASGAFSDPRRVLANHAGEPLDLDLPEPEELKPRRGLVIGIVAASMAGLVALPIVITSVADDPPADVKASGAAQLPAPATAIPEAPPRPARDPERDAVEKPAEARAPVVDAKTLPEAKDPKAAALIPVPAREDDAAKKATLEKTEKGEKTEKPTSAGDKPASAPGAVDKAAAPAQKRKPEKAVPGLLNGGDRFDPLNGAL